MNKLIKSACFLVLGGFSVQSFSAQVYLEHCSGGTYGNSYVQVYNPNDGLKLVPYSEGELVNGKDSWFDCRPKASSCDVRINPMKQGTSNAARDIRNYDDVPHGTQIYFCITKYFNTATNEETLEIKKVPDCISKLSNDVCSP